MDKNSPGQFKACPLPRVEKKGDGRQLNVTTPGHSVNVFELSFAAPDKSK